MNLQEVALGRQGRIVIPAALRQELGLEEGAALMAHIEGRRLILETRHDVMKAVRGSFRAYGTGSVVDDLLAERRAENKRDGPA